MRASCQKLQLSNIQYILCIDYSLKNNDIKMFVYNGWLRSKAAEVSISDIVKVFNSTENINVNVGI